MKALFLSDQEGFAYIPNGRPVSESGTRSSDDVASSANQLILKGDVEGALRLLKSHLTQGPFDKKVGALVESLLLPADGGHGLIDFYKDLQKSAPDDWRIPLILARAYSKTGKDSIAVVQLQKLLRTDTEHAEVWMELATCYQRLGKSELALRALNSLIDIQPNYVPAHVTRLRYLVQAEDLQEAAAASIFSLEAQGVPPATRDWLDKLNLLLEQGLKPSDELLNKDPEAVAHSPLPEKPPVYAVSLSDREKTRQLLTFTSMVTIMVKGGLSFSRIFGLLAAQHGSHISAVLPSLEKAVMGKGEPLSKAMARHPEVFSDQYVAMIEIGESTNLSRCLERLCEQLRTDYLKGAPIPESARALVLSCRNLVDVLEAGGSESKALAWASRACVDETVRRAFQDLETQVRSGMRLAECKFPPLFTPLFPGQIAAHDAVGAMSNAFKDLPKMLGL